VQKWNDSDKESPTNQNREKALVEPVENIRIFFYRLNFFRMDELDDFFFVKIRELWKRRNHTIRARPGSKDEHVSFFYPHQS